MTETKTDSHHSHVHRTGPGYTTKAEHTLTGDTKRVITSRRHRKGRGSQLVGSDGIVINTGYKNPWFQFWAPTRLTWWVAVLFVIGSALFSIGGYISTFPHTVPNVLKQGMVLDGVFFIGSLFFTSAAFCQLLESINAGNSGGLYTEELKPSSFQWVAWNPGRIGYIASLIQLIGTVMFNFNTGFAFLVDLNWIQQDLLIWAPNIIGCVCFLIASRLSFMEVCHAYWGWQFRNIEWWIAILNLVGSVSFMISALYSIALPEGNNAETLVWLADFFTFQGGICFLIGSYLLLPEMFSE